MAEGMLETNKATVRALVEQVINRGHLELIDQLYAPEQVAAARAWIAPFRRSFPDVAMEIVELIAEADAVVGRFHCSATQRGTWHGHRATGRRFERVAEVGIYRLREARIVDSWTLEDTDDRLRQLGITDHVPGVIPQ